jgi:superfamily II DNA or RNA helicase
LNRWFGRRRRPTVGGQFKHRSDGDWLVLSLEEEGRSTPFESWIARRPQALAAVSAIQAAAEQSTDPGVFDAEIGDDQVRMSAAFVARLDAAAAAGVGLPPPTTLALDLKPRGLIADADFMIQTRWVRPGGQPVRAVLQGALLSTSDGPRRIPEPLWSLHRAASRLSEPLPTAERFRALAELRASWPNDPQVPVESEPYLRDLRVHFAASVSLKLKTLTPERTDFDPVLFGGQSLSDAEDEARGLDEDLDNVLTPASQKLFADDRFRRERDVRPVYVLRDGEYVFIDPSLRPALDVIRKLQDRPEAERRAFILNPRKVLRDSLGDELGDSADLDHLFVETEQFSNRVAGVDVWRAPVLPWLTPSQTNKWLPERFGLRIGEDYFLLDPKDVAELTGKLDAAIAAGEPTASVPGLLKAVEDGPPPPESLPATQAVRDTVEAFAPFASSVAEPDGDGEPTSPPLVYAGGKLFLIVRENFDEVEFEALGDEAEAVQPLEPVAIPPRLRTSLKAHQVEGLNWLASSALAERPGALLADDMGLGKTLQAIAFMAWLQDQAEAGVRPAAPFLIIAPTGLLGTWRDEIVKHLDLPRLGPLVPAFGADLRTLREEGGLSAKDIETGRAALRAEAWRDAGVVLTTYETMRDYHFSFARTRFGLIIYDEIQKLKNPASQMTRAAKALNGVFSLGMTGTPVENRLQDLWSIMDVIAPGLLGASREFERRHQPHDVEALGRLKVQLMEGKGGRPAHMLRRMKSDALEGLPGKHVHPFELEMPPVQASAYRDLVVRAAAGASGGTMGKGGMLSTLAAMRGVSLHPLDPRQAPPDLATYAQDSARLSRTLSVLDEVSAKNEKALIFVEDLAMQERLAGLIKDRFRLAALPARINGGVPGPKRQALVTAFQQNRDRFDVMILSPKAGGVGLTLTSANHVIHLSRWWNPAVEDQATDRVFRIGQTKDVHVHLPMAVHPDPGIRDSSFDLRLNALIERKRQLTRDLFLPPEPSDGDLSDLFNEVSLSVGDAAPAAAAPEPSTQRAPAAMPQEPEPDAGTVASDARAPGAEVPAWPRPVISLPRPLSGSGVRYWRVGAGEPRPTDDILGLFRGKDVVQVAIRDPYALGSAGSRQAQVRFLAELAGVCRSLEAALIEYAPEIEGDLHEGAARRDVGDLLARFFPRGTSRFSLMRRPKRSQTDDFHDRTIELNIRHAGGAVRLHELALGRGAEALFDERRQCTVTYAPPGADA